MAKNEGAFTKVPNWILDDTSLNVYHKAVLVHIARQTIGYGKKSDGISISQFAKATGIGKTKIGQTLSELEKKRCIKVKRQTLSSGGKSFNRYSLPPYPPHGEPYPPHDEPHTRHTDIQKKIEQKREGERIISDEDKRAFIAYLIDGENIRNPKAYERNIRAKLNKQDKATMEIYEQWQQEQERALALQSFRKQHIGALIHSESPQGIIYGSIANVTYGKDAYIVTVDQGEHGIKQIQAQDLKTISNAIQYDHMQSQTENIEAVKK